MLSVIQAVWRRVTRRSVKDELEREWASAVTDEGTDAPQTGQVVAEPSNKPGACRIQT